MVKNINKVFREIRKEAAFALFEKRPRKILFDHLPKCGGSTLNAYLRSNYRRRKTFATNGTHPDLSVAQFKTFSQKRRYAYDLILGHHTNALIDDFDPLSLKVTVLREPVDRIVSHYYYAKRFKTHYLHAKIVDEGLSLEDYAASDLSHELRNWFTVHFSGMALSEAEAHPEIAVEKAVDILMERYDIIGFLEDFDTFVRQLQSKAGLRHAYASGRENVTKERPPIAAIPSSTLDKIARINALDVALYDRVRTQLGYGPAGTVS